METVAEMNGDETNAGKCKECGSEDQVYLDTNRCPDCDIDFGFCSICDSEQHVESCCRHIWQDGQDFEWRGSGASMDPELRGPLFKLFDLMPPGFPRALRSAVASGKFYTFLIAPMIGSGGLLELHGMPDEIPIEKGNYHSSLFYWGAKILEIGESDNDDESGCADGYYWLASLYEHETPEANGLTIRWIDEYLAAKKQEQDHAQ